MPVKVLIADAEAFPEGSGPEAGGYELRKVAGVPELVSRLTKERPDAVVYVRGDRKVDYGTVMRVMGRLSAAGYRRVALVTEVEQGS